MITSKRGYWSDPVREMASPNRRCDARPSDKIQTLTGLSVSIYTPVINIHVQPILIHPYWGDRLLTMKVLYLPSDDLDPIQCCWGVFLRSYLIRGCIRIVMDDCK